MDIMLGPDDFTSDILILCGDEIGAFYFSQGSQPEFSVTTIDSPSR